MSFAVLQFCTIRRWFIRTQAEGQKSCHNMALENSTDYGHLSEIFWLAVHIIIYGIQNVCNRAFPSCNPFDSSVSYFRSSRESKGILRSAHFSLGTRQISRHLNHQFESRNTEDRMARRTVFLKLKMFRSCSTLELMVVKILIACNQAAWTSFRRLASPHFTSMLFVRAVRGQNAALRGTWQRATA